MNKLSKFIIESPIWFISILIPVISVIFYLYHPFQFNLFPETAVKKLYYIDNISDAQQFLINKFNRKYKNQIEVVPVNLPFYDFTTNDRKEILTRSLRSHSDGIDIFAVDLIWIPRFAKWGYTIDKYFDKETLSRINRNVLQACYSKGNLVAFPLFTDMGILFYRKDLIDSVPGGKELETKLSNSILWEDFIEFGSKFKNRKNPYYIYCGSDFEGMACTFFDMVPEDDIQNIFTKDNVNLKKPSVKRSLETMYDFIHKYNYSPVNVTAFDEYKSYLYANAHDAVFLRGWVGYNKQYKKYLSDTTKMKNLQIAPLPHFKGDSTSGVFGGWHLMISKSSNRKEEAIKFIKFMFEKENQEILYDIGGILPVNNEVYEDSQYVSKHPELMELKEILKWGKNRPFLENYTKLSELMTHYFHAALKNEITVDEAIDMATQKIDSEYSLAKEEEIPEK